jgi:hypothetical protein
MLTNPEHLQWMAVFQQLSGENLKIMACLAYKMFALLTTGGLRNNLVNGGLPDHLD